MRERRVPIVCLAAASVLLALVSTSRSNGDEDEPRFKPTAGAVVSSPPLLRWRLVRGATLYNVQVWRGTKKILSRWPTRPRLQLQRTWVFKGQRYRLTPGRYFWFVWPRFGGRFGRVLVRSSFVRGRAPVNTSPPTVTGTPREGMIVTAAAGTWTGLPAPRLTYQWQRCDEKGDDCEAIAGATAATRQIAAADIDGRLRVVVTATNAARSVSARSTATAVVLPAPPSNVSAPTVTGEPHEGYALAAATGGWTSSRPIAYSFAWQRCEAGGGNCAPIAGANGETYTLTAAEVERSLRVVITAANAGGSSTALSGASETIGRVFLGTEGNDFLEGTGGADLMRGEGGDDRLRGDSGNDRLYAGTGEDVVYGGPNSDQIFASDGSRDMVFCGTSLPDGPDEAVVDGADKTHRDCEIVVHG